MAEFVKTVTMTVNCPYCGNGGVNKWGRNANGKQTYRCKPCGKRFLDTGAVHGRKTPSNQVGAAISLFYRGMSYKQLAEAMVEMYDIEEPSKRTLYEWVKDGTDAAVEAMQDYPADVGSVWVADEMQVKVGGEQLWNWNVMDARTRYVLASHLSPNRDQRAAVAVMRKAAEAAKNPPRIVKTDRLGSYPAAVKQVFPDARHVQSDGIRGEVNNNLSERVQGTYRQRIKTLRGLENMESGQRYLDGWTLTYNLFREHEGIDNQTPGEMAKVKAPFKQWEDVVKQHPPAEEQPKTERRNAAAELSDARLRDETTAGPNVHFVPDPTRRRRPKGETDSDDPDEEWPPSGQTVTRWHEASPAPDSGGKRMTVAQLPLPPRERPKRAAAKVAAVKPKPARQADNEKAKPKRKSKRPHQYAKARKEHQNQGRKSAKPVLVLGQR